MTKQQVWCVIGILFVIACCYCWKSVQSVRQADAKAMSAIWSTLGKD